MFEKIRINSIASKIMRLSQLQRIYYYKLISKNSITGKPILKQPVHCAGAGIISIKDNVIIGIFPSPFFLSTYCYLEARNASALISIGENTWINNNFCAIADHSSISISQECLIGTGVEIYDSDFHGLSILTRKFSYPEWAQPVTIGNNVFIGSNTKILKGVSIGDGSIIAAGSIVVKNIPSGVIGAGNPARVIRKIE